MNVTSSQPDHLYILDRMKGSFKDVGEASTMDRVLSHLSAGGMRVAPPREAKPSNVSSNSGAGVAGVESTFEKS
ncbi:hypothetical protein KAI87_07950 [Myxococcota bacterium]|nr:hypothetical protein [Myxococcota bacterium]